MSLSGRVGNSQTLTSLANIDSNTQAKNSRASMGWGAEVRFGDIPGVTSFSIVGHNAGTNGDEKVLSPWITGVPNVTQIVSARLLTFVSNSTDDDVAGIGALTLFVTGLDASGNQQTESIILTGQSGVNSANTYTAVNQLFVSTVGSTGWNVGFITVTDSTDTITAGGLSTNRCYFSIEPEWNFSMTSIYTVPTGCMMIANKFSSTTDGTVAKPAEIKIKVTLNDTLPVMTINHFTNSGNAFDYDLPGTNSIAAGGHWRNEAWHQGAGLLNVIVYVQCYLVDLSVYNV